MGSAITFEKPRAEVVVEGELSPFEEETLNRLLKRSFRVDLPTYVPFPDEMEDLTTRINITFHYPYTQEFFSKHFQESWRQLKDLVKNIRYRRGNAGAAFVLAFLRNENETRLVFHSGSLGNDQMSSAIEQVGYLTGIVGKMLERNVLPRTVQTVECRFDHISDRWSRFEGKNEEGSNRFQFNEKSMSWEAKGTPPG